MRQMVRDGMLDEVDTTAVREYLGRPRKVEDVDMDLLKEISHKINRIRHTKVLPKGPIYQKNVE